MNWSYKQSVEMLKSIFNYDLSPFFAICLVLK